ncbi:MAG TPA: hypothetical protein VFO41_09245 [Alphaproteobacteria bacterium]|nr:hypothetical protein [Alphaproteobacteria bacterium]
MRPHAAILALPLLLGATGALAQDRCSEELDALEQDVQTSELSEQERSKYEQLLEGATSLRDAGEQEDCLMTIDTIRRVLFIYPRNDQSGEQDQAG